MFAPNAQYQSASLYVGDLHPEVAEVCFQYITFYLIQLYFNLILFVNSIYFSLTYLKFSTKLVQFHQSVFAVIPLPDALLVMLTLTSTMSKMLKELSIP